MIQRGDGTALLAALMACLVFPVAGETVKILVPESQWAIPGKRLDPEVPRMGGFVVMELSHAEAEARLARTPGAMRWDEGDKLRLIRETIDTRRPGASARAMAENQRSLKLVQFVGRPGERELAALEAAGARRVEYVPENAWLVWWPDGAQAKLPGTQFVGDFLPRFAINPQLDGALDSPEELGLLVTLVNVPGETVRDLEWMLGQDRVELLGAPDFRGHTVLVSLRAPGRFIGTLAERGTVLSIGPARDGIVPQGDMTSLVMANQTKYFERPTPFFEGPSEGAYSQLDIPNIPAGKHFRYVDFLEDKLGGFAKDYKDSRNYPLVTIIDDGIDTHNFHRSAVNADGSTNGPLNYSELLRVVDNPDLYEFGQRPVGIDPSQQPNGNNPTPAQEAVDRSRVNFVFGYRYREPNGSPNPDTIPTVSGGVPEAPNPSLVYPSEGYPQVRMDILTGELRHGVSIAPAIIGYNEDNTNADRFLEDIFRPTAVPNDNGFIRATGHSHGTGVSPYGRIAAANISPQFPIPDPDNLPPATPDSRLFQPNDVSVILSEVHRRIELNDGIDGQGRTAITNNSYRLSRLLNFALCDGLDGDTRNITPTAPGYFAYSGIRWGFYGQYATRYDELTRRTWFHSNLGGGTGLKNAPTLFVTTTENQGWMGQGASPFERCSFNYADWENAYWDRDGDGRILLNGEGTGSPDRPFPPAQLMETIQEPGISKNVLTVGGSEAYDYRRTELCSNVVVDSQQPFDIVPYISFMASWKGEGGDSADDLYTQQSRGRVALGQGNQVDFANPNRWRVKPEVVVPVQNVYVNTIDIPGYAGNYDPCDPTLFASQRSTTMIRSNDERGPRLYHILPQGGTSQSPPLASGALQLSAFFLENQYGIANATPSLLKAYLIHTAKMLGGENSGPYYLPQPGAFPYFFIQPDGRDRSGNLPQASNYEGRYRTVRIPNAWQGFGRVNLELGLDPAPRYIVNENHIFDSNFTEFSVLGRAVDPQKPVRAVLVWTDAASQAPVDSYANQINDLDLTIRVGQTVSSQRVNRYFSGNYFKEPEKRGFETHCFSLPYAEPGNPGFLGQDQWNALAPRPTLLDLNSAGNLVRDRANNSEAVFLESIPANAEVQVDVETTLALLRADALDPYFPGAPRQDFSLVVYNFQPHASNDTPASARTVAVPYRNEANYLLSNTASGVPVPPALASYRDGWFHVNVPAGRPLTVRWRPSGAGYVGIYDQQTLALMGDAFDSTVDGDGYVETFIPATFTLQRVLVRVGSQNANKRQELEMRFSATSSVWGIF